MPENIYSSLVMKEIPRLLSLIDENEFSPTYGCFDRKYWRYKIVDCSNARMQEAAYTLALIYKNRWPDNLWYNDEKIRKSSIAAVKFWTKLQTKDGSFNEYTPHEHSHVATAFSTYAIAQTCKLLNLGDKEIVNSLGKACEWLNKNDDPIVINHDAGAAAALYTVYELTGKRKYLQYCKKKLRKVFQGQDEEGWFSEYGAADIGYQTFTIYYLAALYKKYKFSELVDSLKRAVDFFSYFVHPDGSFGGDYGSREASLIVPTGFEMVSDQISLARSISHEIRKSLVSKRIVGPCSFDDRFLASYLYPYLECCCPKPRDKKTKLPRDDKNFTRLFKNCGLFIKKTPKFYFIANLKKGGTAKIFKHKQLAYTDTGWVTKKNGDTLTTNGPSIFIANNDKISVDGYFYIARFRTLTTLALLAIRFSNLVGLYRLTKSLMRKKMITEYKKTDIRFRREIQISETQIKISDFFTPMPKSLMLTSKFSHMFSTTSGLYQQEPPSKPPKIERGKEKIDIVIS